jgi:hypothetical protein
VIRYLVYEARLALHPAIWLLPGFLAVLRLTGVIQPKSWGWLGFLEVMFPLLFPLLSFSLLAQEKNWNTLEVWASTPRRKAISLLVRYLTVLFPLFSTAIAAIRPEDWLLLLAPGFLLGGFTLAVGLALGEEVGLGAGLSWWGVSFILAIAKPELLGHKALSWFSLVLFSSSLSPQEELLRKWVQLGVGLLFLLLALEVAERKRSWKTRE